MEGFKEMHICFMCQEPILDTLLHGSHPAANDDDIDSMASACHPQCLAAACIQEATLNEEQGLRLATIALACIKYNKTYSKKESY